VALVRKAAYEIRITFSRFFGENKINELVVTSNKLTNNFTSLVTSSLGLDVALGPPVGPLCLKLSHQPFFFHILYNSLFIYLLTIQRCACLILAIDSVVK
jgi:hypothetical protein